jgi:hypothetical protein
MYKFRGNNIKNLHKYSNVPLTVRTNIIPISSKLYKTNNFNIDLVKILNGKEIFNNFCKIYKEFKIINVRVKLFPVTAACSYPPIGYGLFEVDPKIVTIYSAISTMIQAIRISPIKTTNMFLKNKSKYGNFNKWFSCKGENLEYDLALNLKMHLDQKLTDDTGYKMQIQYSLMFRNILFTPNNLAYEDYVNIYEEKPLSYIEPDKNIMVAKKDLEHVQGGVGFSTINTSKVSGKDIETADRSSHTVIPDQHNTISTFKKILRKEAFSIKEDPYSRAATDIFHINFDQAITHKLNTIREMTMDLMQRQDILDDVKLETELNDIEASIQLSLMGVSDKPEDVPLSVKEEKKELQDEEDPPPEKKDKRKKKKKKKHKFNIFRKAGVSKEDADYS